LHIRADKFYPPQVDTPQFLFRERLIDDLLRRCGSGMPAIILEAQAGQGKTTTIKQFLNRLGVASAWYQVGPEDEDPAFFLLAIPACIADLAPGCPSAATMQRLTGGDVAPFDLPKRLDLLLDDLRTGLKNDLYVVFDDLHNLIPHETSLFILNYLIENAPPRLHFILSSRAPLPLDVWQSPSGGRNPLRICNRELALGEEEVTDFFQRIFHLPLSHDAILEIASNTDGWVMGIVLLGLQMTQQRGAFPLAGRDARGRPDILGYFRREVFASLEPGLRVALLPLSLLEDIPVALARTLTAEPEIGRALDGLVQRNLFIRHLDPDATVYGLHHLFRQFLRERAKDELGPKTIQRFYRQAGQFFFQQGNPSQALRYLLQAGDYAAMEAVLQQSGPAMLAANQTATLTAILSAVPEPDLVRLGWIAFYLALAHLDFAPARALPLLSNALAVFSARQDAHGELLCLAHSISVHITTTGLFREGEELLARAEHLFARIAETLDATTTILLAYSLAMGRCIFLADTDTATRYANLALTLARKEGLVNFEAGLLMVMGYIRIFAGQMSLARIWLEQAAAAVHRPEVGTFNSLAIRMMLFNTLYIDGDFANYFDQKNQLVAAIGSELVSQAIAGPFCYVWEMDIAINQGRFVDAQNLADQTLALHPPLSPHLRSQVLHLQAVVLASQGQPGPALAAAEESARLREEAGGMYFITLNNLLCGLTHGLCGQYDQAVALLTMGIDSARRMPTAYLEACGLLHRGAVHLDHGNHGQAGKDIEAGLGLMRQNAYRHFWAWTPRAIQAVFGFAAARKIETDYARALAAERIDVSLRENGSAIPRIEFRVLGEFTLLCRGVPLRNAEDMTPAQRELLALLLASPGLKIAQETAQLHFWPDSPTAAAKAKLDTLISRLRKTLVAVLPGSMPHDYLNRERGMLWLAHCRVDALDFQNAAKSGLTHSRMQEYWQAGNAFARAEALWQGEFAPGVTGEDHVRAYRNTLVQTLTQMALAWCGQLAAAGRLQPAIELAEKALGADPVSDVLWALLYRLHGRHSAIRARQVLNRFANRLRAEDFPEHEIAELIEGITSARGALFSPGQPA
jgi:ATP/maltotriose-dependent transcriptional regulator MalT/DNA-binding SARP family transcriptional activator